MKQGKLNLKRATLGLVAIIFATVISAAGTASAGAAPNYVALGDSYSTGQGLPGTQGPPCFANPVASYEAKASQVLGTHPVLEACSGATTTDIIANQLGDLDTQTQLVTVTAGGNDVGVFDFIGLCVQADCSGLPTQLLISRIITELPAKQKALYSAIAARIGPNTKVRVMGYPLPMTLLPNSGNDSTKPNFDPVCPAFSPLERVDGGLVAATIDAATRQAVNSLHDPRFKYVSALKSPFLGHELCGAQTPDFQGSAAPVPFHPNDDGTSAYAQLLLSSL